MTIAVDCPHCESTFQLSPDLAGKAMRCPNPDCREVFTVPARDAAPPAAAASPAAPPQPPAFSLEPTASVPAAAPLPYERVEASPVGPMELVPEPQPEPAAAPLLVLGDDPPASADAPTVSLPRPLPPAAPPPVPKPVPVAERAPPRPADRRPFPAAPVPVAAPLPPRLAPPAGPKEVVWSGDAAPPTFPAPAFDPDAEPHPAASADAEPAELFVRRRRRRGMPGAVVALLVALIVGLLGGTGYGIYVYFKSNEARDAELADADYKAGSFGPAAQKYMTLQAEYPNSDDLDRYRFFQALADTRAAVEAVTAKQEPAAPLQKLKGFVAEHGQSPYAQPAQFGADIVQTGSRMIDALAGHAGDRLKEYRRLVDQPAADWQQHLKRDREDPARPAELDAADQAVKAAEELPVALDRFRGKEGLSFDDQKKKLAELAAKVQAERDRREALGKWLDLPADPTDERIEHYERFVKASGLTADKEAGQVLAWAKEELRRRIAGWRIDTPPTPPPGDAAPVLFAAPLLGSPAPKPPADAPQDAAFAVSRGVLYALDAGTGSLLWGCRVGGLAADPRATDLPTRVALPNGRTDLALVASDHGGRVALTARDLRTGKPVWHQPLEAPFAGRPVVLGRRVYVPLADPAGTVAEIQTTTGVRVGSLSIRQRVGSARGGVGLVGRPGEKPGEYRLFVPADARRVFEFTVGGETDEGTPRPPTLSRVIATDHPRDSLTGDPLLVGPAGSAPRFLVLAQADGESATKLRCFPLDQGDAPTAAEAAVAGWSWFPPGSDGERVLVATDAGAVAIFGLPQAGNPDRPLFPFPGPKPGDPQEAVNRSLVVTVDEDSAWVVVGGRLVRLRTAVDPAGGLRVVRSPTELPVGEPVHRAELLPKQGLAVVVTRTESGAGRATAFDPNTGDVRWQRQLGATAMAVVPVPGGRPLLIDEDGGVSELPADGGPAKVVYPPLARPAGRTAVAASADGKAVWVLTPEAGKDARLRVRTVVNGIPRPDAAVSLPAALAGPPAAADGGVLLPLANGTLYRLTAGGSTLTPGPVWKAADAPADAVGFVAPLGDGEYLVTDGNRGVVRWKWPADGGSPERKPGAWEARGRVVLPPAVLPGEKRFAVADAAGNVQLFDADAPGDAVRRWRGGVIPAGEPTLRLEATADAGKPRLRYGVGRKAVVCLDPDAADPLWVAPEVPLPDGLELVGWATVGDRVAVTDQTGRVQLLDAATGKALAEVAAPLPDGLAAKEATPVGGGTAVLPLADGTAAVVPLGGR